MDDKSVSSCLNFANLEIRVTALAGLVAWRVSANIDFFADLETELCFDGDCEPIFVFFRLRDNSCLLYTSDAADE